MERYLLDTNVFIRYFRKDKLAIDFIYHCAENKLATASFVTLIELLNGIKTKKGKEVIKLISEFIDIDYSSEVINKRAYDIFYSNFLNKGLDLVDSIIAATCLENDYILITENIKDFKFVDGLEVYNVKQAAKIF